MPVCIYLRKYSTLQVAQSPSKPAPSLFFFAPPRRVFRSPGLFHGYPRLMQQKNLESLWTSAFFVVIMKKRTAWEVFLCSELYMKPAADYVTIGREVDSYTLAESAARRGEVYVGYRHMDALDGRVVVNPPRDEPILFGSEDQIVVIAEN